MCSSSVKAALCLPDAVAVLLHWGGDWKSWKLLLWNSDSSVETASPQTSCCPISFGALGWSVPGWGERQPSQRTGHCEEVPREVVI